MFLARETLEGMGFRHLGDDVLVSDRAALYFPGTISLGDGSRIDDFCIVSGDVTLGRNVHLAAATNVAGGRGGVTFGDFSGAAYACQIIAQSDDYSGRTMTNPTVPTRFKRERIERIEIGRHAILGTQTVVLPGAEIAEGVATGAQTVVRKRTEAWTIYVGNPAKVLGLRSRDLLLLEEEFLRDAVGDSGQERVGR